ncbi:uncharacterized protein LOC119659622 isoform X2 [Hermetia illucens]|uniref:uncharacterized protein LOC119659622 isoform X2 n=1 Tax=Hermetia illucens TaxID=343691 RepID=UPI0018CC5D0C|nr:uncharacterized protein LOC119659622 isoform X2 [Hermetia illucens]
MNYFLHQQKRKEARTNIPPGLPDLMADIARRVLEKQPENGEIYKFIADYLGALLETREKAKVSVEVLDEILESSLIISDLLRTNGIDFQRASNAAKVIQGAFRSYLKEREKMAPQSPEFDEYRLFKELVEKCNFKEEELLTVKGAVRVAFREFFRKYSDYLKMAYVCGHDVWPLVASTCKHYADKVPSFEKMDKAATKIQAFYRRHSIQKKFRPRGLCSDIKEQQDKSLIFSEQEVKSATVIQKVYRLYKQNQEKIRKKREERLRRRMFKNQQLSNEEAATRIQAIYRGYKVRKALRSEEPKRKSDGKDSRRVTGVSQLFRASLQQSITNPAGTQATRERLARNIEEDLDKLLVQKQIDAMYLVARKVQQLFRKVSKSSFVLDENVDPRVDWAARVIQNSWRDMIARQFFIEATFSAAGLRGSKLSATSPQSRHEVSKSSVSASIGTFKTKNQDDVKDIAVSATGRESITESAKQTVAFQKEKEQEIATEITEEGITVEEKLSNEEPKKAQDETEVPESFPDEIAPEKSETTPDEAMIPEKASYEAEPLEEIPKEAETLETVPYEDGAAEATLAESAREN